MNIDRTRVREVLDRLEAYCADQDYEGWDPYDGLNSRVFQTLPFSDHRLAKLIWIQLFKRNPINLRSFFQVPKQSNSQGLALFVSGYCNLVHLPDGGRYKAKIPDLVDRVLDLESAGWSGSAWGYNFEWQARAFHQPRNSPTVVATSFVVYALLDAFDQFGEPKWLDKARSACDFILKDLNRTHGSMGFGFSYSPLDDTVVYNATLLASRALSRVYAHTGENDLIQAAEASVAFCCENQQPDGSWVYGTKPYHNWIDSFHTGYNLEALSEYQQYSGDSSFERNLERGLDFYLNHFFTDNGVPKYYHDRVYPIDINCPAQFLVTLFRTGNLGKHQDLTSRVLSWTFEHMLDSKGYFYYQLKRGISSRIPYMRWAQAWMFNSLSFYLLWAGEDEKAG